MAGWKKALFGAVTALAALCLVEGGLSFVRALRGARGGETMREAVHTEYDAELGWVNLRDFHDSDLYGEGRGYTTNAQKLRAKTPYATDKPADTYRIVALGDSFTMGYGVDDDDTYPAQLQAVSPGTQVINMGMGGYGLGQDYLWYMRDGKGIEADLLLFAFIAHDFERLVLTSFMGYEKPRVRPEGTELVADNTPVPPKGAFQGIGATAAGFLQQLALGKAIGAVLRPLQKTQAHQEYVGFQDPAAAIFKALSAHAKATGQDFVLVYLPTLYGIRGELEAPHKWLLSHAPAAGLTLIDLTPAFEALTPRELGSMYIPGDAHYSPKGNRFVAEQLKRALSDKLPRFAAVVGAPAEIAETTAGPAEPSHTSPPPQGDATGVPPAAAVD